MSHCLYLRYLSHNPHCAFGFLYFIAQSRPKLKADVKAASSREMASVAYMTAVLSLAFRDLPGLSLKFEEIISLQFLAFLWGPDLFD